MRPSKFQQTLELRLSESLKREENLASALKTYGRHLTGCGIISFKKVKNYNIKKTIDKCTCGLDVILKQL